jgi:hypothetical protein
LSFVIRSIDDCVKAFHSQSPEKELLILEDASDEHYEMAMAWSFEPFEWPDNPPRSTLYLCDLDEDDEGEIINEAHELMEYGNFQAVGTWNANGEGHWYHSPNQWSLLSASLLQEQDEWGEELDVIYACWRVKEGIAYAIWGEGINSLLQVVGLDSLPEGDYYDDLWHGE